MSPILERSVSGLAIAGLLAMPSLPIATAVAQQADDDVVIVTGSFIRRDEQADLPSPLQSVGAGDIEDIGAVNIADITQTLTINTGAENNPDAFTQNATTGTSSINLRGLGLASTLVLLDGKRQVSTAAQNNDGVSFVDTSSLVPLIAIERVEILKDGASALYGSDAVAGVVNFITRENYDGLVLSGNTIAQTVGGKYDEHLIQGLWGKTFDQGSLLLAASWTKRNPLTTEERRLSRPVDDASLIGNPGAFIPTQGPLAGLPVIDPTGCEEFGGLPQVLAEPIPGTRVGFCRFDFGDYYSLVANEEKAMGFGKLEFDFSEGIGLELEVGYADNEATRNNSPTFPYLQTPLVPTTNPFNIFGQNVIFLGRPIGNGGEAAVNTFDSETLRASAALTGDAFRDGYWELSYVYGKNDYVLETPDVVSDRFDCSLFGFDGATATGFGRPQCADPELQADVAAAGLTGTFFNAFATSFQGLANDPALLDFLVETQVRDLSSELNVVQAIAASDVWETPHGPASIAVGAQFRRSELSAEFDDISVNDGFGFLIGEQPYEGEQDVYAVFGELAIPLAPTLDVQLAVRFEDYDEVGSTTDPKVAVLWRPTDAWSFRASYSTSFRAPSVFQQQGQGTTLVQVNDPATGGTAFAAIRTAGNTGLEPEESEAYNIGLSWRPANGFELDVDYFNFDFTDVITEQSPQAIINADPNDPRVVRSPAGTILQVNTSFVNASSVETSGIDWTARFPIDIQEGTLTPTVQGTYVLEYDLVDPIAGQVDGEGSRNFNNFGTSTPELRFNAGLDWEAGPHSANVFARYISEYDDDQNPGREVQSQTQIDLRYALALNELMGRDELLQFAVGIRNATDEDPPEVFTNGGYDSKVHDPRGRLFYVGLDIEF